MTSFRVAEVAETLGRCAASLVQRGPARWIFSPGGGAGLDVDTRVEDEWLAMTLRLPERPCDSAPETLWACLRENGRLPGGVKLAWLPGEKELSACAEIYLDAEIDLKTRLSEVCAGLQMSAGVKAAGSVDPTAPANLGTPVTSPYSDLRELLDEAGWAYTERQGGGLVVDLKLGDGRQQAALEKTATGRVSVTTDLVRLNGDRSSECRQALGLLLLRACGVVRMARAAADANGDHAGARFEVVFDTAPSPAELSHALGSLAAALGLLAREARLLGSDEHMARQYLALGGSGLPNGG